MSEYGLRVRDTSGNTCIITPGISNIISSGTITMPTSLNDDNTYGYVIDLPGTTAYSESDIGVLITIRNYSLSMQAQWQTFSVSGSNVYGIMRYIYNPAVYYTRNISTGVMSEWAEEANADTVYNLCPIYFWDKIGTTTFTSVQLFACVCLLCYDASATTYKTVYRIDSVATIDYAIYLKNYHTN
jgi:hypothetical protein